MHSECKIFLDANDNNVYLTCPAVLMHISPPVRLLTAVVKVMCEESVTRHRHVAVSTSHRYRCEYLVTT